MVIMRQLYHLTISFYFCAFFLVISAAANAKEEKVPIIEHGTAKALLVLPSDPSSQAEHAAAEFQKYVKKITGVRLEIKREGSEINGWYPVYIGHTHALAQSGISVPSGLTPQMNEEGFIVAVTPRAAFLAGNEERIYSGTLYAVYDVLESWGCRWFFPGPFGEVIPSSSNLYLALGTREERPGFRFRNLWYSGWGPVSEQDRQWYHEWCRRNRVNSLSHLSLPADDTVNRLVPVEPYFQTHPEAFALDNQGKRVPNMVCPTEPTAVQIAVETACKYFRENPEAVSLGVAPPDGHPRCYCARCRQLNPGFNGKGYGDPSESELWFDFINRVAEQVREEFPDRWIFTNGYANRVRPPEGLPPLSPNLGIQSAMIASCTVHRIGDPRCWQRRLYETVLSRWVNMIPCVFVYDYDPGKVGDGTPFPSLHTLQYDMRWLHEKGVWGFWTEANNTWMITHLNYYIRARLMWNVNGDVKAWVRDYCERFYGPAGRPIERYIWTLENAVDRCGAHVVWGVPIPWRQIWANVGDRLETYIAQAERKTVTPEQSRRREVFALVHDHLRTFVRMEEAAARADFAEAVRQAEEAFALRGRISEVQSGLLPPDSELAAKSRWTLSDLHRVYKELAERMEGPRGRLFCLLPQTWEFKPDPRDVGALEQWYLSTTREGWNPIDITLPWQWQGYTEKDGYPYCGKAWYRIRFPLGTLPENQRVFLTFGGIYHSLDGSFGVWVWVNGKLLRWQPDGPMVAGKRRESLPVDLDVTDYLKPNAENVIAVQIFTRTPNDWDRGGLYRRAFLWSSS